MHSFPAAPHAPPRLGDRRGDARKPESRASVSAVTKTPKETSAFRGDGPGPPAPVGRRVAGGSGAAGGRAVRCLEVFGMSLCSPAPWRAREVTTPRQDARTPVSVPSSSVHGVGSPGEPGRRPPSQERRRPREAPGRRPCPSWRRGRVRWEPGAGGTARTPESMQFCFRGKRVLFPFFSFLVFFFVLFFLF